MSDPSPKNLPNEPEESADEKRRTPRIAWREAITMELENGHTLLGFTRDISRSGLFMETENRLADLHEGEHGLLAMAAMDEIVAIFCQVTRITNEGVGVLLLDGPEDTRSATPPTFHICNEMCLRMTQPQGFGPTIL